MKPKIASIGSCVANELLSEIPNVNDKFDVDPLLVRHSRPSSSFIPVGPIGERLYDEMHKITHTLPQAVLRQYKYATKDPGLRSFIEGLAEPTVIVLDNSYELASVYLTDKEEFLIHPNFRTLERFFPDWFVKEVHKNVCQYDMFTKVNIMSRHHRIQEFIRLLKKHGHEVVAIDNVYTNREYIRELNCVSQNISTYNKAIPFVKVDDYANYEYAARVFDQFYTVYKKITPHWTWVPINPEHCFSDPHHKWGQHPVHLHLESKKLLALELEKCINIALQNLNKPKDKIFVG